RSNQRAGYGCAIIVVVFALTVAGYFNENNDVIVSAEQNRFSSLQVRQGDASAIAIYESAWIVRILCPVSQRQNIVRYGCFQGAARTALIRKLHACAIKERCDFCTGNRLIRTERIVRVSLCNALYYCN